MAAMPRRVIHTPHSRYSNTSSVLLHHNATSSRHVTSARLAQGRAPVGRCSLTSARRQTRDEFRQRCKRSCAPVCDDVSIAACAKRHTIQHSRCANWCDGTVPRGRWRGRGVGCNTSLSPGTQSTEIVAFHLPPNMGIKSAKFTA